MIRPALKIVICFSFCFAVVYTREIFTYDNVVGDDTIVADPFNYGHESEKFKNDDQSSSGDDDNALNDIEGAMPVDEKTIDYISNESELPLVGKIPGGKDIGKFTPIRMPADFESYDINATDGYITLLELVAVTGAKENVQLAFKDSDADGDGRLTKEEFLNAPLTLQGFVYNDVEELIKVENEIIKDEKVLKRLVKEMEETNDTDTIEKLRKALEDQRQNEIEVESEIRKQLYNNNLNN